MSATVSKQDSTSIEKDAISCDPDVVGGVPVFSGTRVPVALLFDYLLEGGTIDEFYNEFPTVSPAHVRAVLEAARDQLTQTKFPSRQAGR